MSARRGDVFDDMGTDRFHVFVPAIMSVGLLFSLATVVRDLFKLRSRRAHRRRVVLTANDVASVVVAGERRTVRGIDLGLLPRRTYLWWTMAFLGAASYVAIGSSANYLREGGRVSDIAWLLAISLVSAAALGALAVVTAAAYVRWPEVRPLPRQVLRTTPLTELSHARDDRPPRALGLAVLVAAAATALVTLLVGASHGTTQQIDEPIADWLVEQTWLDPVRFIDPLGRTDVAVLLATLIGLAALRCRPVALLYPGAVVLGVATSFALRELVERPRPLTGVEDSFPSGHVLQAALIAGLLPLALETMTESKTLATLTRTVLVLGVVASAVHRVRIEAHWPLDVVAGALVGATLVLAVHWVIAHRAWHARCRGCAWREPPDPLHGVIALHPMLVHRIHQLAALWSAASVIGLVVLAVRFGLPNDPEGVAADQRIERWVQLGAAVLLGLSGLLSLRWHSLGAVLGFVSASLVGTFAAVQYRPALATTLTVILIVPSILTWLGWQHRQRWSPIGVAAVLTTVTVVGTWSGASALYDRHFGPTHPESVAEQVAVDAVEWVWSGGLGPDRVSVVARVDRDAERVRLEVRGADGSERTSDATVPDADGVVRLDVTGLTPGTEHDYTVVVDGEADRGRGNGTFTTADDGPMSFRIAAASCARTGSNGAVFDTIAATDPLLYLLLGDAHYENIGEDSTARFVEAYDRLLTRPGQAALYRSTPIAYVWDDHDFGPNDADGSSPSGPAAREVYRDLVPHADLVRSGPDGSIEHAFTIGRIRFVLTDNRSHRSDDTLLGAEQEAWLIEEIAAASADHAVVVWANGTPWIGAASPGSDTWAGYAEERERIAEALVAAGVDDLVIVSGDAHMVALDDGTNSPGGFPVLQAAALDRPGSVKGGPYSGGTFPGGGQFGTVEIVDDGGERVEVLLAGHDWTGTTLVEERFVFEVPPA
ncbi:MAG: alkaline phosphatase D family protein [Actinomycetota bacterium]